MVPRVPDVIWRLVPESWRAAIRSDIEEEARICGRGRWWCLWQMVRVALRLRWTITGDTWMSDIRYAIRSLLHARWFTIGAVLTFALGIGVNAAVFALVDRVLFRPLPYRDPSRLILVASFDPKSGQRYTMLSKSVAIAVRQKADTVADLGFAGRSSSYEFPGSQEPPLSLVDASSNALELLGVQPALGRGFSADDVAAKRKVALIRYEVWQGRFGGETRLLGRLLTDRQGLIEIVGVLPRLFVMPSVNWAAGGDGLLLSLESLDDAAARASLPGVFARLRPGATVGAVQQEFDALLASTYGNQDEARRPHVIVEPLQDGVFWRYHTPLQLLFAGASLVWLLGCANLGVLMLARARKKEAEIALRVSLGASHWRILSSAILESLLVCGAGAVVALVVLALTLRGIGAVVPGFFRSAVLTSLDARMIAFTLGGAMAGAVIAGVFPARRTLGIEAHQVLQRGTSSGRRVRGRSGRGLLVLQSAVSTVLVAAAVLSIRSLFGLVTADLGFQPRGLYAGYGLLAQGSAPVPLTPEERLATARRHTTLLREHPGIAAASSTSNVVFGRDAPDQITDEEGRRVIVRRVLDDYFAVMQTRVVAGRVFSNDEISASSPVAVVSVSAARKIFPGDAVERAVGRVVRFTGEPPRQIVGLVADIRRRPTEPVTTEFFTPARPGDELTSIFRARPGVTLEAATLRPVFAAAAPVSGVALLSATSTLEPGLQDPKLYADIFGVFALVAVLLATVGLFAVASGDVSLRRYEMGVRLTLGASPRQLQRMVTSQCVRPVVGGIVLGLVGAWWAGRFMQSLLHEVDPHDPATLAIVAAVLIVSALVASWWPARRAGRTDPAIVLRAQ